MRSGGVDSCRTEIRTNELRSIQTLTKYALLETLPFLIFHGGWGNCSQLQCSKSASASLDLLTFVWLCQQMRHG